MEDIINDFKLYCRNNPTYVKHHLNHEDLIDDYMFENGLYGIDIFNKLCEISIKINRNMLR